MKDKRTSVTGWCWATGVSPTTRDNNVQPPIKETLHIQYTCEIFAITNNRT